MRDKLLASIGLSGVIVEGRLNALERWQQRIIGGLILISFVLGGGGVAVVIELTRK